MQMEQTANVRRRSKIAVFAKVQNPTKVILLKHKTAFSYNGKYHSVKKK